MSICKGDCNACGIPVEDRPCRTDDFEDYIDVDLDRDKYRIQ